MIPENLQIWNGKEVVVALSGGVDSAVAALTLINAGARVRAVFMKNWHDEDEDAGCHDKGDLIAAAAAADCLGVDFDMVNFAEDYRRRVFEPFLAELRGGGRTPNPDVLCNSEIKFAAFYDYARANGAAAIATGHYARNDFLNGRRRLLRGEDSAKDQTYFLHRLTAAQLDGAIFPLGGMHKTDVRAAARAAGLENWARKDSTGICFIGERRFPEFLSRYLEKTPGDIVDDKERRVGRHDGLPFYTIGQRRALGIGGGGPWFVFGKDKEKNLLRVVNDGAHPLLFCQTVRMENLHWIGGDAPPSRWVYSARLRHRQPPDSCTLVESAANGATIVFAAPQRAATPGQYAVLYDGNVCLGGGVVGE